MEQKNLKIKIKLKKKMFPDYLVFEGIESFQKTFVGWS